MVQICPQPGVKGGGAQTHAKTYPADDVEGPSAGFLLAWAPMARSAVHLRLSTLYHLFSLRFGREFLFQ
jgi:hypothetical protein